MAISVPMKLSTFIRETGDSRSAFAARLNVHPSTITRLIDGSRVPSGGLLAAIQRETGGRVSVDDFDWSRIETVGNKSRHSDAA